MTISLNLSPGAERESGEGGRGAVGVKKRENFSDVWVRERPLV